LLNDTYKLNHCKEMGAKPGRRFLIQPAAKLEFVNVQVVSHNKVCVAKWSSRNDWCNNIEMLELCQEFIHLRPHSFETTFIWDHIHLRPHSLETTFTWDHIHFGSHSFYATLKWSCFDLLWITFYDLPFTSLRETWSFASQWMWSQMNVVSNEVVSNECGLKWM